MRVRVIGYSWWATGLQSGWGGLGVPIEESTDGFEEYATDLALKANEDHKFPLMILLPASTSVKDATAHPLLRKQILIVATCDDVEGTPAGFVRRGLFVTGPVLPYPARMVFWKGMDDETALRIHNLQRRRIPSASPAETK
jgi:hypothetical protein